MFLLYILVIYEFFESSYSLCYWPHFRVEVTEVQSVTVLTEVYSNPLSSCIL